MITYSPDMPSRSRQSRSDPERLLPIVAAAFAELGYRGATTAQLAQRCGVRENILYRAWPSKKAMFLASIDYVFDSSLRTWQQVLATAEGETAAHRVLDYESVHHGEFGLYRVVFTGLSETNDPDIHAALGRMYLRFQQFIAEQVRSARRETRPVGLDPDLAGWALVGVGTVFNIARELGLLSARQRQAMMQQVGRLLLEGNLA